MPILVDEEDDADDIDSEPASQANEEWHSELGAPKVGDYVGYKWGIFLRAPDIFFKLLKRGGSSFVPLGSIAEIKFGIKSGCDKFFFVKDVTDKMLEDVQGDWEFKERFGIPRKEAGQVRLIEAGDGSVHLVEAKYLEPVVFNLMGINSVTLNPAMLKKHILLVGKNKEELQGTYVLKYIESGEREGFDALSTCKARFLWYDLGEWRRSAMFWPMAQRYRHLVPQNPSNFVCNHNLFDVFLSDVCPDRKLLAAILNSTLLALFKYQFGRLMGGDPVLKTEVVDVKMMLSPDPRKATAEAKKRLVTAFESLSKRTLHHMIDVDGPEKGGWTGELAKPDRQELDDAVLELLGIEDANERQRLRAELYAAITDMYRYIRMAEKDMQKKRSQSQRRGVASAQSTAEEVWESFELKPLHKTPLSYVSNPEGQVLELPGGRAKILSANLLETAAVTIGTWTKDMKDLSRAKFVKALSDEGVTGPVCIPNEPAVCAAAVEKYEQHKQSVDEQLASKVAQYTADEKMQERVIRELKRKMRLPISY